MKKSGKLILRNKCLGVALGSLAMISNTKAQNSVLKSDTITFFAPIEVEKYNQFKFLIQDDYKLISETNDTLIIEKYQNIGSSLLPVKIIIEKNKEDEGSISLFIDNKKHVLKLISDFVYFENNVFKLTLNPGGQIHKTFKIDHKSHMSHASHYSHYSCNPKQ
jgi:hypothetical protein